MAATVAETAERLVASAGEDAALRRQLGRALRGSEVLSFMRVDEERRKKRTQGLEVRLGFYSESDAQVVSASANLVEVELGLTLGGFIGALQISTELLDETAWLGRSHPAVNSVESRHLHRRLTSWQLDPIATLFARRVRGRQSVDHADGQSLFVWWVTPETSKWAAEAGRWLRDVVGKIAGNQDQSSNDPNYWGDVDLESDPLTVLAIGPFSGGATEADVRSVLARAGRQLTVKFERVPTKERDGVLALPAYVDALGGLASDSNLPDIVLVYRGGGLERKTDSGSIAAFRTCVANLTALGIEVVVGLDHGTFAIYPDGTRPVGVHEAVTPTAAANYVLREHVNYRLAYAEGDPGQP
jgi:hypothetical protein